MTNKISACLVVRNEEKIIKKCLDSIKDVVDEIIIVHDGEYNDKTLKICKIILIKFLFRDILAKLNLIGHLVLGKQQCEAAKARALQAGLCPSPKTKKIKFSFRSTKI